MSGTTHAVDWRPTPVADEQQAFLPAMGHRWLLPLYDPFTRLLGARTVHEALLDAADVRPGHRVLEIGCGTGNLTLLAKARQPQTTVVGLDPDLEALARGQRKSLRRRLPVQFDRGYASDLPYADGSFDRVLSSLMLHHVPAGEKQRALTEARRVLAPGGEFHIVDLGGPGGGHGLHGRLAQRVARDAHLADQVGDGLIDLLRAAGFSEVTETATRTLFVGHVVAYRARR